ncbi:MAG TPA: ArgE/DapE family deacylase [Candidatus Nanopelagicaceae bacterium]
MIADDQEVIDLLADLVRIDSSNPDLVPGSPGETQIAQYISGWFAARSFEVHLLEKNLGRPSIVGIGRGSGGGRTLMLNGHIDTVSLGSYQGAALNPEIRDGNMYGRGTFDMKGGIAAMMVAAHRAHQQGTKGDILVACVADEEAASFGTSEVLEHFHADGGLVIEPSYLQVTLSHKGFAWFEVTIHGLAAHGSRPELGIDAIAKAGHFLVALEEYALHLTQRPGHPRLGFGTVHASLIKGGEEASSYPATCTITVERRTIPGETAATVTVELLEILDRISANVPDFEYALAPGLSRLPFQADPKSEIVKITLAHVETVLGEPPVVRAEPFWTDCALLDAAGIPCLLFGVDGGGAHAATEWVTLESLAIVARALTSIAVDFCN